MNVPSDTSTGSGRSKIWALGYFSVLALLVAACCNAAILLPLYLTGNDAVCADGIGCSALARSSIQRAVYVPIPLLGLIGYGLQLYGLLYGLVIRRSKPITVPPLPRILALVIAVISVVLVLLADRLYGVTCRLCLLNAALAVAIFAMINVLAEFEHSERICTFFSGPLRSTAFAVCAVVLVGSSFAYSTSLQKFSLKSKSYWGQVTADMSEAEILGENSPRYGVAGAPIKVVAFTDPQCPACLRYVPWLIEQAEGSLSGQIEVYYRHYPLPMHPEARDLSKLAILAHLEGYFDEMRLHVEGATEEAGDLLNKIDNIPIDRDYFISALSGGTDSELVESILSTDIEVAKKLGTTGTPFFVVLVPGGESEWILGGAIEDRLVIILSKFESRSQH